MSKKSQKLKVPKYLAAENTAAHFIDVDKFPKEEFEENGNDKCVFISFLYLQDQFECFNSWTSDEMKQFWKFYKLLSIYTWQQVLATGGKKNKSSFAYTQIRYEQLPTSELSEDETYFELRVNQKLRVFGFRSKSIFYLCWLDREHRICSV